MVGNVAMECHNHEVGMNNNMGMAMVVNVAMEER